MNYADAERFASILEAMHFEAAPDIDHADVLILNSCSVRQKAEDRILGLTRVVEKLKINNPELIIILTGCMARRTWQGVAKTGSPIQMTQIDREKQLKKSIPWVDFVVESKDFYKLPEIFGIKVAQQVSDYLSYKPHLSSKFQGYVPISTGCDHFCTYCIVPFARGREVCRDAKSILKEVKELVDLGYKDITLLGQTVNRYINPIYDSEYKKGSIANTKIPELNTKPITTQEAQNILSGNLEPKDFLQLLQAIDELQGDFWITFMSSHPNYMTPELIEFMGKSKHIRPYIHFALQSGSDAMLKRMNRRYNVAEFIEIAKLMKEKIPWLGLSTDIIVGFPKESEAEFKETATVMEEIGFDMAFLSEFSPRKGTPAALIPDDIPHQVKTERKQCLNDEVLAKTAFAHNKRMEGEIFKTLIEKIVKGKIMGRTGNYKEIEISTSRTDLTPGQFVNVKVTHAGPWALKGDLCDHE